MADILPKPVNQSDSTNNQQANPEKASSQSNRTMWSLVVIVVIAVIALVAVVVYNYFAARSQDYTRKNDLSYINKQLNTYYDLNHYYPTLNELNSSAFGAFYPSGINRQDFKDPTSNNVKLTTNPSITSYAYEVLPKGCDNLKLFCNSYRLVATLSNNKQYVVVSHP